ncbi:hypothetical protein MKX01_029935 [Papaver californicum]|nr:hypothetical protein MKX01_029935 [Papaver californicum]
MIFLAITFSQFFTFNWFHSILRTRWNFWMIHISNAKAYHLDTTKPLNLLEPHPALKCFKSTKKAEHLVRRFGDVLALAVISGGCYEVYVRTT